MGRAAGLTGHDASQSLHLIDRCLVVDEDSGLPVSAAHEARNFDHQTKIDPRERRLAVTAIIDSDPSPGLALAFGRRMFAEREHAWAEERAAARQHELALDVPLFNCRHS